MATSIATMGESPTKHENKIMPMTFPQSTTSSVIVTVLVFICYHCVPVLDEPVLDMPGSCIRKLDWS